MVVKLAVRMVALMVDSLAVYLAELWVVRTDCETVGETVALSVELWAVSSVSWTVVAMAGKRGLLESMKAGRKVELSAYK